ncbi:MAG TPA: hypothetical protein DIT99_24665 [Candidatus Latescibacteria bacterium]|nr:hypothetical protein [Candidatus Latescibacterota bacterium]
MIDIRPNTLDFCGTCVAVCHVDAIEVLEAAINIDQKTCDDCCKCVYVCPLLFLSSDILLLTT